MEKPGKQAVGRRNFLKSVAVGGAAAAIPLPDATSPALAAPAPAAAAAPAPGYSFLNPTEAAFVEAVADVMIPADDLTPSGTDLGIAIFIDRQLGGAWGKGARLYRQGPYKPGTPQQGYQLPLVPAEFYRAGIRAVNLHCVKTYAKEFDRLTPVQRNEVLVGLDQAKITLEGVPGKTFFEALYDSVMEGMFADPIHGGNRDKTAWKLIGYPGVIATHAQNIETYRNKRYEADPTSIADLA